MAEKRVSNSELHLQRLEEEEARRERGRGILEIFPADADAPLSRDDQSFAQGPESARADSDPRRDL